MEKKQISLGKKVLQNGKMIRQSKYKVIYLIKKREIQKKQA